ncbi:hypothetical protein SAMN05421741_1375 [Paenimyroides ummariense]|uniref:Uncharacterized protein n=1 Tax=Paenimyroides ummariense TaxID=913024 RepID=A0A1I5G960_9FLAO|nr:hypothetical protein SAMN05421741_1375 [Paenimyroides ummariense]
MLTEATKCSMFQFISCCSVTFFSLFSMEQEITSEINKGTEKFLNAFTFLIVILNILIKKRLQ